MEPQNTLHRRKSSKDTADENTANQNDSASGQVDTVAFPSTQLLPPPNPSRNRVQSTPVGHARSVSSASAFPAHRRPPAPLTNGARIPLQNGSHMYGAVPLSPTSLFRSALQSGPPQRGHARTRSVSAFAPASPSPLASSFPASASAHDPLISIPTNTTTAASNTIPALHVFPSSHSAPDNSLSASPPSPTSPIGGLRHTRLHSRNLSFFFPRPGALSSVTIAEDGTQELELGLKDDEAPVSDIPAAGSSVAWRSNNNHRNLSLHQPPSPLGVGFTFGGKPPSSSVHGNGALPIPPILAPSSSLSSSSVSSRRGHHHKHSISYNFFSFLEPGTNGTISPSKEDLHTLPTPTPVSPWTNPKSLDTASSTINSASPSPSPSEVLHHHFADEHNRGFAPSLVGISQFAIGSWLWVVGQQVGSLACTGLGYWVVFDALGVTIEKVIPRWLNNKNRKVGDLEKIRRPYGNPRLEAVLMFSHSVYLMFSAVYVCKETVEHILLSLGQHTGGSEKHHHHFHSSEENGVSGIDFPISPVFISLISLIGTALVYNNHEKLVNVTNTRIPSLRTLIRSLLSPAKRMYHELPPMTQPAIMLSNPYVASPLFFCLAILFIGLLIPPSQHEACDMILAAVVAIVTFNTAYSACTVLGTILLQTAPPRGLPGAKMEAFLRAMRELERHPQVLHLPAPHIWQLAPSSTSDGTSLHEKRSRDGVRKPDPMVVTIELHVKPDLSDEDVLNLTRWAWERCVFALGGELKKGQDGKILIGQSDGPEVTVGVVRG